jgi:hypothetical protein
VICVRLTVSESGPDVDLFRIMQRSDDMTQAIIIFKTWLAALTTATTTTSQQKYDIASDSYEIFHFH